MPLLRRSPVSRLDERMCLGCGYRGPELQGPHGLTEVWCPECGEDLYSRPARSYRELEGLTLAPGAVLPPETPAEVVTRPGVLGRLLARARRVLTRWI